MFPTEQLNVLWLECSQNEKLVSELRFCLQDIADSSAYQAWLKQGATEPFALSVDQLDQCEPLVKSGLISNARLQVKINRIGEKIFITDGLWVRHLLRVFPDPDESLLLLDFVKERDLHNWAQWVIDPGAGCGHTPIGFMGSARRISCDANARALLFSRMNAKLNQFDRHQFMAILNDMTEGFPSQLSVSGNVLFLANVPFAPSPRKGALALNSAGGKTGADLQLASFRMVHQFQKETKNPVRACFLTWTVGSLEKNRWEVPDLCREIFPERKVKWTLVQHDYDAPEIPNPAPVTDTLLHLAKSQYAVNSSDPKVREEYQLLAENLIDQGQTHIAYGMLEVDLLTSV